MEERKVSRVILAIPQGAERVVCEMNNKPTTGPCDQSTTTTTQKGPTTTHPPIHPPPTLAKIQNPPGIGIAKKPTQDICKRRARVAPLVLSLVSKCVCVSVFVSIITVSSLCLPVCV